MLGERSKTPPRAAKDGDPLEVEVPRSPIRCPYCHDGCDAEDERAMVCQGCLSRHHGPCWREGGGRCASCGGARALQPVAPQPTVAPAELALLRRNLPREAVERLSRRLGVPEAAATQALLEAATRDLEVAHGRPRINPWTLVVLAAVLMPFVTAIVGIIV